MRRSGFTLLEILAVVVLVGVISGAGLTGLAHAGRTDALTQAVEAITDRGHMIRLTARGSGPISLDLHDHGWRVARDDLPNLTLSGGVSVEWRDAGGALIDHVVIDLHGRSPDLTIQVRQNQRHATWRWLGFTGELVPGPEHP